MAATCADSGGSSGSGSSAPGWQLEPRLPRIAGAWAASLMRCGCCCCTPWLLNATGGSVPLRDTVLRCVCGGRLFSAFAELFGVFFFMLFVGQLSAVMMWQRDSERRVNDKLSTVRDLLDARQVLLLLLLQI